MISPIAVIVLVVIPVSSVIISILILEPAINLSCFLNNVVSILTTYEDKLFIPLVLEFILPSKLLNVSDIFTPFTITVVAVIEPLDISTPSISGGFRVILSQIISLEII